MELQGKIKLIREEQIISDKFKKREFVISTDEQYPQHIQLEFIQDKTSILNNFVVGDDVNVGINIKGREWTDPKGEVKYFNTINAWFIKKIDINEIIVEDAEVIEIDNLDI